MLVVLVGKSAQAVIPLEPFRAVSQFRKLSQVHPILTGSLLTQPERASRSAKFQFRNPCDGRSWNDRTTVLRNSFSLSPSRNTRTTGTLSQRAVSARETSGCAQTLIAGPCPDTWNLTVSSAKPAKSTHFVTCVGRNCRAITESTPAAPKQPGCCTLGDTRSPVRGAVWSLAKRSFAGTFRGGEPP